jgi:pyrroline-5-carboxylate reductase
LVGEGISVFSRGANAGDIDVERVDSVLRAVGDSLEAPEELMNPVTALSGTGPAYIFHTMEAMIESGIEMGMSPEMAERLVLQTVLGAARLAIESPLDTTALREGVTSKGGTTEAAISHLGDNDYVRLVIDAILAARDRSEQLGE